MFLCLFLAVNYITFYFSLNPVNPQVLIHGSAASILMSNYDYDKPMNVIIHGWLGEDLNAPEYSSLAYSVLTAQDSNVIVVDWRDLASSTYTTAVAGVPSVGQHLGDFVIFITSVFGIKWNLVHFIGFGLGAHVAGIAGQQSGGRPTRITG